MKFEEFIITAGIPTTVAVIYYIKSNRRQTSIDELKKQIIKLNQQLHNLEIENAGAKLNPHLLKNTLGTIHFFSSATTDAIGKLSKMLSYILNESNKKYVTLNEELEFLNAYFQVHKLKLSPQTQVNFNLKSIPQETGLKIAPMITVNFIENAFVHGDYTLPNSELSIDLVLQDNTLYYTVSNTFTPQNKAGGIGYENFKKRLELLHKDQFQVSAQSTEKLFTASLKLRLHAN